MIETSSSDVMESPRTRFMEEWSWRMLQTACRVNDVTGAAMSLIRSNASLFGTVNLPVSSLRVEASHPQRAIRYGNSIQYI